MRHLNKSGEGVGFHPPDPMSPDQAMLRRHSSNASVLNYKLQKDPVVERRPRPPLRPPLPARLVRPPEVYVSSSSRLCLARDLDGLVEITENVRIPPPLPPKGVQLRDVWIDYNESLETQAVSTWLEGWSPFFVRFLAGLSRRVLLYF